MNNFKFLLSFFTASIIILQSCSVEKRHYSNGYHIEWKKVGNSKNNASITEEQIQKSLTASIEKKKNIVVLSSDSIKCDTIIMKDGTEVKAKVLEVTPTEIKYKFCNNIDGPLYIAYRYNLSYVKYANGTMDSFVDEHPPLVNYPANRNNIPNPNNGDYNQNNRTAVNGNDTRYSIDNFAISEYVRKISLGSLICGIVSLFIPYVGLLAAIAAIILGTKSMLLIRKYPQNLWMYGRRAMAGQIIGWIVAIIYLLVIIAILAALHII